MHPPAPTLRPTPRLLEICLLAHPVPEANPLVPVEPGRPEHLDSTGFLGWQRLSIGLLSSSAQRRGGRWVHRADWAWLSAEAAARERMGKQAKTGHLAALAVLWLPVHGVPETKGKAAVLGPSPRQGFEKMQWRVYRSMLVSALPAEAGLDYLFVQEYIRASSVPDGGRDSWRHWVLSA